jgi:hypothetical protein
MYSTHLQARRRRLVWFTILSSSFLVLLFFRDNHNHVHHLGPGLGPGYGGNNRGHTIGAKVTHQELALEANQLHQHKYFHNRHNKKGQFLRYRIKKAHPQHKPRLGSIHGQLDGVQSEEAEQDPPQQSKKEIKNDPAAIPHGEGEKEDGQAAGIVSQNKDHHGDISSDTNSIGEVDDGDEYDYFFVEPGSLKDKVLLEDYVKSRMAENNGDGPEVSSPTLPPVKKTWNFWSFDLDPPRPPLPKPENILHPKTKDQGRGSVLS